MMTICILYFLLAILFFSIGVLLIHRENKIKKFSTNVTTGTVIKYSISNTRAPVVEYFVNEKKYKKALKYTYRSATKTFKGPVVAETKDDILDTKLRIRSNSVVSAYTIMAKKFPLGTRLNVYYNQKNPKLSYVERYAPQYIGQIFLASSLVPVLVGIIMYFALN